MIALVMIIVAQSIYLPEPYEGFWNIRLLSNKLIEDGYRFLQSGEYQEAYEAFKEASYRVWDRKDQFAASLGVAITAYYLNKPNERAAYLKKAYELASDIEDSSFVAMWEAYILYRNGDHDGAFVTVSPYARAVGEYDPVMLGLIYLSVNQPDSVVKYVRAVNAETMYIVGYAAYLTGNYNKAIRMFRMCTETGENSFIFPYAIYMLGESYRAKGDIKRAAATMEKLAYIYTGAEITEKAIFAAVCLYDSMGRLSKADSLLNILISWYWPRGRFGAVVRFKKAEILVKIASKIPWDTPKRYALINRAIAILDSIKNVPDDLADDVVYLKAKAYYRMWDHYDAERMFEYGVTNYPNSEHYREFLFGAGRSAFYRGNYRKTITYMSKLLNDTVYSFSASYYIGAALYREDGNASKAMQYLEYALLSPRKRYIALAAKEIGDIYLTGGEIDSALTYYRLALKSKGLTKSDMDDVIYNIEYIKYLKGEYKDIVEFADKFSDDYPNNPNTLPLLLNAFKSNLLTQQSALKLLRKAVRIAPFDSITFQILNLSIGHLSGPSVEPILDTLLMMAMSKDRNISIRTLMSIADLYEKFGLYFGAIKTYRYALSKAIKGKNSGLETYIRYLLASNYLKFNDYLSSTAQFDTAFSSIMQMDTLPYYFLDFMEKYVDASLGAGDTAKVREISEIALRVMNSSDRLNFIGFLNSRGIDILAPKEENTQSAENPTTLGDR